MNVKPYGHKFKANSSQKPTILVVEDEEDNLLYISHALIFLKYTFITATKGQDALDLASKYKIDLMLLDLVLPDMSGFELVGLLRENKSTKNVPIIAISALTRERERERAITFGCNDFLSKPYFIDELDRIIRQYLPQPFFDKHKPFLWMRSCRDRLRGAQ